MHRRSDAGLGVDVRIGRAGHRPSLRAGARGKRVPVVVPVDGGYTYPTTVGVMGGRYLVSFNSETRKRTGRGAGDEVEVELVVDPDR
ncbi:MAG: DUF1905 domain-containing protein [Actinobacteria bacterium]|nr:DUF1905 domain-containing protein [Actinomycetota bacterium]